LIGLCGGTESALDLIYDDSGTDLVCTTTLQTVTPFKLYAFSGENHQETGHSRIRDAYEG
jgi:hypothetical protein